MGEDKAFLQLGDQLLIERVLEVIRVVVDDITIVTNTPEEYERFHVRLTRDVYPGIGALGGLYTGLLVAEYPYSLVVACDMPFLNVDLLQYMAGQTRQHDAVIPYMGEEEPTADIRTTAKARDLHPLHAIYNKRCLEPIRRALDRGDLRMIAFLPEVDVRFVGRREIDQFDPQHRSFFNANTPAELRYARELDKVCS